jgi:hypothetical protein
MMVAESSMCKDSTLTCLGMAPKEDINIAFWRPEPFQQYFVMENSRVLIDFLHKGMMQLEKYSYFLTT